MTATPPHLPTDMCRCTAMHPAGHAEVWECTHTEIHAQLCPCMHRYVCACIYAHMHTCTHTDAYAQTQCTHIQTCTRTHTYTCTHKYMHACTHTCAHAHIHMHTCTHTHVHACVYTHMRTCIYAHTRTRAHVHTHRLPHGQFCSCSPLAPATTLPCADSHRLPQAHGPCQALWEGIHLPPPNTKLLGRPSRPGLAAGPAACPARARFGVSRAFPRCRPGTGFSHHLCCPSGCSCHGNV